jgi:hypothetical protein
MVFGYLTLAVAFFLSVVAAYYSVLGLVAIFSAAVIPVMIMGGALETGKVIAAMWLHRNWHRAPWTYKAYLLPSLLALMLLTSMGTFGYLSKAHSDQSLVSGDVQSKIALYDEKIRISRENIDANRAALKQLDAAVDQIMGRSTTEQGAERSVQIRRQQGPERQRLIREIEAEQKKISDLNEARAPIAAEVRKVEAEVGPIKYIAALIYGDNPENNLLESAVRWVIILIVSVFDPLAIVLILAGTRHLEWERELKRPKKLDEPAVEPVIEPVKEIVIEPEKKPVEPAYLKPGNWFRWRPFPKPPLPAYLTKPWIDHVGEPLPPQVYRAPEPPVEPIPEVTKDTVVEETQHKEEKTRTLTREEINIIKHALGDVNHVTPYEKIDENFIRINGKTYHRLTLSENGFDDVLADLINPGVKSQSSATFGVNFPERPNKGDMHVHIGVLPSKLYKFSGSGWMEVDKNISDSYTHNEAYIKFLVEKIEHKELSLDDLSDSESDMILEYLKNAKPTNNAT